MFDENCSKLEKFLNFCNSNLDPLVTGEFTCVLKELNFGLVISSA